MFFWFAESELSGGFFLTGSGDFKKAPGLYGASPKALFSTLLITPISYWSLLVILYYKVQCFFGKYSTIYELSEAVKEWETIKSSSGKLWLLFNETAQLFSLGIFLINHVRVGEYTIGLIQLDVL